MLGSLVTNASMYIFIYLHVCMHVCNEMRKSALIQEMAWHRLRPAKKLNAGHFSDKR